jgi:hypothetical protein
MLQFVSARSRLVVGLLTLAACVTAPVTPPPPKPVPVAKKAPEVVAKAAPARDQAAFGFSKGMTVAQASSIVALRLLPGNSATYATRTLPVPHPPFSEGVVVISPTVGLCRVMASTPPTEPSRAAPLLEAVLRDAALRFGPPDADLGKDPTARAVWAEPFGPGSTVWVYETRNAAGAATVLVDYLFTNYQACRDE